MRVQRMVMPVTEAPLWTLLDNSLVVVRSAERFLAHLSAIERSSNTVRAYAHSMALWFEWLELRAPPWDVAEVKDVPRLGR